MIKLTYFSLFFTIRRKGMRRSNKYFDEFKEKVVKNYLDGMSRRQVMDKYDINAHSTITRWVKK
jgi:transposase-like protein